MRTITRFLRRFLILLIVFVIGVAGTAFLMNNETTDDRSDMNNTLLRHWYPVRSEGNTPDSSKDRN